MRFEIRTDEYLLKLLFLLELAYCDSVGCFWIVELLMKGLVQLQPNFFFFRLNVVLREKNCRKGLLSFGSKTLRFPLIFLFMKSKGANIAWVCIIMSGNWLYRNFFRSDFPGKRRNWISSVFTLLPKHIKIKLRFKYKSVSGRVVKETCTLYCFKSDSNFFSCVLFCTSFVTNIVIY